MVVLNMILRVVYAVIKRSGVGVTARVFRIIWGGRAQPQRIYKVDRVVADIGVQVVPAGESTQWIGLDVPPSVGA